VQRGIRFFSLVIARLGPAFQVLWMSESSPGLSCQPFVNLWRLRLSGFLVRAILGIRPSAAGGGDADSHGRMDQPKREIAGLELRFG
jgi:hypothetical protein